MIREPSDADIVWLLSQVAPPPSPPDDLLDRIMREVSSKPALRPGRRRWGWSRLWLGGLGVSLIGAAAAAAAAVAWNGERFDLNRLAEAPRVVIERLTHHRPRAQVAAHHAPIGLSLPRAQSPFGPPLEVPNDQLSAATLATKLLEASREIA